MPLSLLSSVEVGEVTEAWLVACLLMLLPSTPAGGCSVEHGEVLLLARLDEGEILCGGGGWRQKPRGDHEVLRLFRKHNRATRLHDEPATSCWLPSVLPLSESVSCTQGHRGRVR